MREQPINLNLVSTKSMNAEQTIQHQLIEAVLSHIPFDGWSTASLKMAAADCGVSEAELTTLFPAGIADAIAAYGAWADEKMKAAFLDRYEAELFVMPVHIKIRTLILIRLEQAAPHKEVVRRTMAFWPARSMQSWPQRCSMIQLM